jgi:hypothetical protein
VLVADCPCCRDNVAELPLTIDEVVRYLTELDLPFFLLIARILGYTGQFFHPHLGPETKRIDALMAAGGVSQALVLGCDATLPRRPILLPDADVAPLCQRVGQVPFAKPLLKVAVPVGVPAALRWWHGGDAGSRCASQGCPTLERGGQIVTHLL